MFTLPKLLRPIFSRHRAWLGKLCRIAARLLSNAYIAAAPDVRPGLILLVQTFGDLANFNPHLHVLAAEGTFIALPVAPEALLAEGFRRGVLTFLAKEGAVTDELRTKLLGWRHCATTREDAPGNRGSGERVRHPRQVHLGTAHPQGLRSGSARIPKMQRSNARNCLNRRFDRGARILDHLGRWVPEPSERGPPTQAPDWPRWPLAL